MQESQLMQHVGFHRVRGSWQDDASNMGMTFMLCLPNALAKVQCAMNGGADSDVKITHGSPRAAMQQRQRRLVSVQTISAHTCVGCSTTPCLENPINKMQV